MLIVLPEGNFEINYGSENKTTSLNTFICIQIKTFLNAGLLDIFNKKSKINEGIKLCKNLEKKTFFASKLKVY